MSSPPGIVVFGYSGVGHACLSLLLARSARVVAVFTHEDDPSENRWYGSVADLAGAHGIQVFKPVHLRDGSWKGVLRDQLGADLILSFYYRLLLPERLLEVPRLGAFNMHGSLLPKYRGCAPINWALLQGETQVGVTLHYMTGSPDAGDIVDQEPVPVANREAVDSVLPRITDAAVRVLDRQLVNLLEGTAPRQAQDASKATYFRRRTPEDGRIDWSWDTSRIFNLIRAVTRPFPGAFADLPGHGRLVIWWAEPSAGTGRPGEILRHFPLRVATGNGALEITNYEWQHPAQDRHGMPRQNRTCP